MRIGAAVVVMHHDTRYWGYVVNISPDGLLVGVQYYAGAGVGYKVKTFYRSQVARHEWWKDKDLNPKGRKQQWK